MSDWLVPSLVGDTAPAPAIDLADVKAQLSIETSDYDTRLTGLISTATRQVEQYLGRALITRQYVGYLDHWPRRREGHREEWPVTVGAGGDGRLARHVEIPMPPLISVESVITYDDSDVATIFDPANYYVDTASTVGRVVLRNAACWPDACRAANAIQITWTCGVGGELRPLLDDDVRVAIIIAVGALNEHRGDAPAPDLLPDAAKSLLTNRLLWL